MTLPSVLPAGRIVYLPARDYEKLKAFVIYKTYPVYRLDREPQGYLQWLEQRQPEIAFDPGALVSESDWVSAGETVFHAPTDYEPIDNVRDPAWAAKLHPPAASDGAIPGLSYVIRKRGLVELGTGSCASCHGRVLDDGAYVAGAQGNFPVERAYAEGLRRQRLKPIPARLKAGLLLSPGEVEQWTAGLYSRPNQDIIETFQSMIPGVAMRPGFSTLDPPKIADLIGVQERRYLDMTARFTHRSAVDIARYGSMCPTVNYFFTKGAGVPAQTVAAAGSELRYSDEQAYAFALYVYSLKPPANPNKPGKFSKRGEAVFQREGCPACHTPPLYTNNRLTPAGNFSPPEEHRKRYDILDVRVGTDPKAAVDSLRGRGYYKVPSLKGVWYRGPFVHNGTILTLEDWFDPFRLDPRYVPTGYRAFNTYERTVPGHLYGLRLSPQDKAALIAFLMTL